MDQRPSSLQKLATVHPRLSIYIVVNPSFSLLLRPRVLQFLPFLHLLILLLFLFLLFLLFLLFNSIGYYFFLASALDWSTLTETTEDLFRQVEFPTLSYRVSCAPFANSYCSSIFYSCPFILNIWVGFVLLGVVETLGNPKPASSIIFPVFFFSSFFSFHSRVLQKSLLEFLLWCKYDVFYL